MNRVKGNKIHIGLCIVSDEPISMRKDFNVGKFNGLCRADRVLAVESETTVEGRTGNREVDEILKRVNLSDSNLDSEQTVQFTKFSDVYSYVFVGDDGKLRRCDILKHKKKT